MGWLDNLDAELNMGKQAGRSGLRPSDTVASDHVDEDQGIVETDPYQVFSERVTIAGLQEAYNAPRRADKWMFRLSLIAAFAAIVFSSIITAQRYANINDAVYDDKEIISKITPFPNISICYPAFVNETLSYEMMEVTKRASAIYEMHNLSVSDSADFIRRVFFWDVTQEEVQTPLYTATRMVWDAMLKKAAENGRSTWEPTIPYCPSVLGNCVLNDQSFDCCEMATPMALWQTVCYHVGMTNKQNHVMKAESMLSLDVSIDWTTALYPDNQTASDGFHIFVDTVPSQLKVPLSVPSQMDVWIVLSQPTRTTEYSSCLDEPKNLTLFDYYDPQGVQCFNEGFLNVLDESLGCQFSAGSYFPVNHSCTFGQNFALSMASSDAISSYIGKDSNEVKKFERLRKIQMSIEESFRFLASDKSPCKPLCSRWTYPVFSVSYSLIMARDYDTDKSPNRSWSRIKVIMPHESYIQHNELDRAMWYMAMCDIGGIMGVYAGFSMVTFAQIVAYGIYVIWYKRKQGVATSAGISRQGSFCIGFNTCCQSRKKSRIVPIDVQISEIADIPINQMPLSPRKKAQSKCPSAPQPKVLKSQGKKKIESIQPSSQVGPKKPGEKISKRKNDAPEQWQKKK